jgi:hypothetical protein
MSAVSKGYQWQKEVAHILRGLGYRTITAPRVMGMKQDFFGAWDLIGKKAGAKTMWVQVSGAKQLWAKRKQVSEFPVGPYDDCLIALRVRMGEDKDYPKPHFRVYTSVDAYQSVYTRWTL